MKSNWKRILGIILAVLLFLSIITFVTWGFSHICGWGIAILISLGIFAIACIFTGLLILAIHLLIE